MKKILLAFVTLSLCIFSFENITFGISESQVSIFGESIGKALIKKIEKKEMKFDKAWGLIEYGVKYYTKDLQKPTPKKDSKNNLKAFCLIYEILRDYNPSVDDTMGSYCGSNNGSNKAITKGDNEDNQDIDSSVREKINQQKQEALGKSRTDENFSVDKLGDWDELISFKECQALFPTITPEEEALGYHVFNNVNYTTLDWENSNLEEKVRKGDCIVKYQYDWTEEYKQYRIYILKTIPVNYEFLLKNLDNFVAGYYSKGYSDSEAQKQAVKDFQLFETYVERGNVEGTLRGFLKLKSDYNIVRTASGPGDAFQAWNDKKGPCAATHHLVIILLTLGGIPANNLHSHTYPELNHVTLKIDGYYKEFDSTQATTSNLWKQLKDSSTNTTSNDNYNNGGVFDDNSGVIYW